MTKEKQEKLEESSKPTCKDRDCPFHGSLKTRGREFKGYVIRKFPRRVVIEFERIVKVKKYERYYKKKTRIHSRLPGCLESAINIGDYALVKECRPLSKIIHSVVIRKIKSKEDSKK